MQFILRSSFSVKFKNIVPIPQRLKNINNVLFANNSNPEYSQIAKQQQKELPPIEAMQTFNQIQLYSKIAYKLNLKQDQQILAQLLKLILIDKDGNFVLQENLIKQIVSELKLDSLNKPIRRLISQIKLKDSQEQLNSIQRILQLVQQENKSTDVDALYNEIQQSGQVPIISNKKIIQELINKFDKEENSQQIEQIILQLIIQDDVSQHTNFIDQICKGLSQKYVTYLLPIFYKLTQLQQTQIIKYIEEYFNKIQNFKADNLKEINQLIALNTKVFSQNRFQNISKVLYQLDINKLVASQLNCLLYIIHYAKQYEFYKEQYKQIEECIENIHSLNNDQLIGLFTHLNLIHLRVSVDSQILQNLSQKIINQIDNFNQQQLFLVFKSCLQQYQIEQNQAILSKIEKKTQEGFFNEKPELLMNVVSNFNKVKQSYFMPRVIDDVKVDEKTFGEWCHLLERQGSLDHLSQTAIDKFKLIHKQYQNNVRESQIYYYFKAAFHCSVNIEQYLLSILSQTKPFQQIRILHIILQAQLDDYELTKKQILNNIMNDNKFILIDNKYIDKGLIAFTLYCVSLMDINIYKQLFSLYSQQLQDIVNDLIQNNNNRLMRKKQFGGNQVNQLSNQSLYQLYQSMKIYEFKSNERLNLIEQLNPFIKEIVETEQKTKSNLEEITNNYLTQRNIKFIRDYSEIFPFRVDFYLPEQKIGIECNGSSHYINGKLRLSDEIKYQILNQTMKVIVIDYKCHNINELLRKVLD